MRRCPLQAVLLLLLLWAPSGRAQAPPSAEYTQALHLRASLDATPPNNRTAGQYRQVLDAFRAVYHADRAAPEAPASVEAVAELLTEQGRRDHNPGLLRAAVEQLDYLRRHYAGSPYATPALLTQGEIEARDLHDTAGARAHFFELLQNDPGSSLAPQARAELLRIGGALPTRAAAQPAQVTSNQEKPPAPQTAANEARNRPSATILQEQDLPAPTRPQAAAPTNLPEPNRQPANVVSGVPVYRPTATTDHTGPWPLIVGIRHWSTASYTRIAIDLQGDGAGEIPFEASRVPHPDRIFFDLHGARLAPGLAGRAVSVTDGGFLERIRAGQFSGDIVRVVLDVSDVSDYSAFWLLHPSRLIIDVHGRAAGAPVGVAQNAPIAVPSAPQIAADGASPQASEPARARPRDQGRPPQAAAGASTGRPAQADAAPAQTVAEVHAPAPHTPMQPGSAAGNPAVHSTRAGPPGTFVAETTAPGQAATAGPRAGDSLDAIAALSRQPSQVRATRAPSTAPVAAAVAPLEAADSSPHRRKGRLRAADAEPPPADSGPGVEARAAEPDATGNRSLARALGLKINRIVVDAGHGGHDSGTLGPGGIEEKDVVLDVALRLGKLLKQRLGADVIYTRDTDTFVPLETRTAIANKAQADLFISIHANSSPDASARGVETYYLNFTTSADALEVAARENAVSDESIHQLSDLVKKITLQDKIAESREFASDVEGSLYQGLTEGNAGLKDRGVKKAPFVVLIGANMPSILAEISFLTNPSDADQLREPAYRQRIAESLYKGVARYVRSLSGTHLEENTASR